MKTTKKKGKQVASSKKKNHGRKNNPTIYAAAIAGIVACVLFIPFTLLDMYIRTLPSPDKSLLFGHGLMNAILLGVSIIFIWGFVELGKQAKIRQLTRISYAIMAMTTLTVLIDNYLTVVYQGTSGVYTGVMIMLVAATSIAGIFFGISLIKLKKSIPLARTAGIIEIISGIAGATILLLFVALILALPTMIVETIILFTAAKKYR